MFYDDVMCSFQPLEQALKNVMKIAIKTRKAPGFRGFSDRVRRGLCWLT